MRRFLFTALSLSLLFAWALPTRAQTQAEAILYPADVTGFPILSAFLDVFNASGAFVSGLKPVDVNMVEDGKPLPVTALSELDIPIQIVVAVNPGPALGLRDTSGTARFDWIKQALNAWAQARPATQQDDLSLVTVAGSVITHASLKDWLVSVNSFQPDFHATTPNLQSLSTALDTVTSQTARSGMKRGILFITPHMDDPNIDVELQPLIQRAVQNRVHVFVWFADLDSYQATSSAAAFSELASQTGGAFYFSSSQSFSDPETYFAPLRKLYLLKYTSAVAAGGQHTLSVQVTHDGAVIKSDEQTFSVDIQPPNPILVSPPLQITRQPPADDPYNAQILTPAVQEIDLIIEFPDGHTRPLASTSLYVDGRVVAENKSAPFDQFTWDLSGLTTSGTHTISVEAVDSLGLKKTSMEIPVTITVVQPPRGISALFAKYRQYITYGAIAFAGIVLLLILLVTRIQQGVANTRRARLLNTDPLTQPVISTEELSAQEQRKLRRPRAARLKPQNAPASLMRLTPDLEPSTETPIPLIEAEIVVGTDPAQSNLLLADPSVASRHARLSHDEAGNFHIRDEGSVAGTWVNFDPIGKEGCTLQHGDVIHFGQLAFRFQVKDSPSAPEPKISRNKITA